MLKNDVLNILILLAYIYPLVCQEIETIIGVPKRGVYYWPAGEKFEDPIYTRQIR